MSLKVCEIMSRDVETASPAEAAELAWGKMRARNIHHLVVRENGGFVGVLSARDLGGAKGASQRDGRTVRELMSRQVITIAPEATLKRAANLLRGYAIGCLPVVDDRRLVGIVTVSDLLDLVGRGAERPVPSTRKWTLKHRGRHEQPTSVRPRR